MERAGERRIKQALSCLIPTHPTLSKGEGVSCLRIENKMN
jgi:hypothetical protein